MGDRVTCSPHRRWLRAALTLTCAATPLLILAPSAAGSGGNRISPKDTFSARITFATGRFSGDHGGLTVYIAARQSSSAARPLTLIFAGNRCRTARHCLDLSGRPTGNITLQHALPDRGRTFQITAAGTVKPLGHVSLSGSAQGVGFIRQGRERLALKLTTRDGELTIVGSTVPVRGFSSP